MNVVLAVGRESAKVGFPTDSPIILQASCRNAVRSMARRLSLTSAMPGVTKWHSVTCNLLPKHTSCGPGLSHSSSLVPKVLVVLDDVEQLPSMFTFF